MTLAARDLVVSFGRHRVLDGLSLTAAPGVTALVGRNGAGKTTLLRVLATVLPPQAGSVTLDGADVLAGARAGYRAGLGWLPQSVSLPRGLRVRDYLAHLTWLKRMRRRQGVQAVREVIERLDLAEVQNRAVHVLSGGTRQRVLLAGAIVSRPRVLLLDEPTAGLDPEQRSAFLGHVRGVAHETVVIVSTHLMEDVVGCATRVALLQRGRICREADLTELVGPDGAADVLSLRRELFPGSHAPQGSRDL